MSFPRSDVENYGGYDIYYSVRTDTGWGPVFNCGSNVNSQWHETTVGISRDGSILLVSYGTIGGTLLAYNEKQPDGTWGPRLSFGDSLYNPGASDEHPTMSPDNNRIIWFGEGPQMGDLYESRKVNGHWTEARPLPSPINGEFTGERDPCLAADGRTLWFLKETGWSTDSFLFVTSVDTSVLSASPSFPRGSSNGESLLILGEADGWLSLVVPAARRPEPVRIAMFDILGRLVSEDSVQLTGVGAGTGARLKVSELSAGTYFISVYLPDRVLSAKYIRVY